MKLAPLVSQPTEVWSELAAVVVRPFICACGRRDCELVPSLHRASACRYLFADDEPTVCERPDKERGAR